MLSKKIPELPKPENSEEKGSKEKKKKQGDDEEGKEIEGEDDEDKEKEDEDEDDELKTESTTAKEKKKLESTKEQKSPKELLLEWANEMQRNLFHNLIEKIREKQHAEEGTEKPIFLTNLFHENVNMKVQIFICRKSSKSHQMDEFCNQERRESSSYEESKERKNEKNESGLFETQSGKIGSWRNERG